jgi:Dolichyl-phosphate-mannose-protein mannosyltransferase/Alg9-like mannosyltransferase family
MRPTFAALRDNRWTVAIVALLLGAFVLRAWGVQHGLPFVYNADENAHFVPRAIGFFDHSLNPEYFINPPLFSYLLHAVFWVRWGGDGVQDGYASDPGQVFVVARVVAVWFGVAGVGLLAWAGVRLFDRRIALIAAALLAVAFLPVHYSHFALNDIPTLAPVCLALVGIAGIFRGGGNRDYVLAGVGLGLACAMKYTAGIVLLALIAATLMTRTRGRGGGLLIAAVCAIAAFVAANPYAVLDFETFWDGLREQSDASNDGGGKLGLTESSGHLYYLKTLLWGLGVIPVAAALGGAVHLTLRDRRTAWLLLPAVIVFIAFMGAQDRFFARWMLPIYPLLCLLAAYGAVALTEKRGQTPFFGGVVVVLLLAQGLVYSVHNDLVLARDDTRQVAREWMVANVPEGSNVVVEPVFPHQWAMDPGRPSTLTGSGNRWNKWSVANSIRGTDIEPAEGARGVKLEDYERTLRPELLDRYVERGYCTVVTGSTQYGRAQAEPEEVPGAIAYYRELRRRAEVVFRIDPWDEPVAFSFDDSFNYRPLTYARPGPEIVVYRLNDCT